MKLCAVSNINEPFWAIVSILRSILIARTILTGRDIWKKFGSFLVDIKHPVCGRAKLSRVELRSNISVRQDRIGDEVRLLLSHIFPKLLFGLGFARCVDIPGSVQLVRRWPPCRLHTLIVPSVLGYGELLVGLW